MRPISNRGLVDNILHYTSAMAGYAAQRALEKTWAEHPMFGIGIGEDKNAKSYQNAQKSLVQLLKDEGCDKA